jgi:hypothetical protein
MEYYSGLDMALMVTKVAIIIVVRSDLKANYVDS